MTKLNFIRLTKVLFTLSIFIGCLGCSFFLNFEKKKNRTTIGNQTWMTSNLNTTSFRNGDEIKQANTPEEWVEFGKNEIPAWCYMSNEEENKNNLGRLYNWFAVNDERGICPEGWHVPKNSEIDTLIVSLGGDLSEEDNQAGKKLKASSAWGTDFDGKNEVSFNAYPNGIKSRNGQIKFSKTFSYWWTSTEMNAVGARFYGLTTKSNHLGQLFTRKESGLCVRCLKD